MLLPTAEIFSFHAVTVLAIISLPSTNIPFLSPLADVGALVFCPLFFFTIAFFSSTFEGENGKFGMV